MNDLSPNNSNIQQITWLWKMAWRDSRTHRKRLVLFMSSIILGIAALVAITSFGENLKRAIDEQAKSLLGADLMISANQPFSSTANALLDSLAEQPEFLAQSREVLFASMAYFPKNGGTRLASIRALSGDFPFYGELETTPSQAIGQFRKGEGALVDQSLMLQYQITPGDWIKIGNKKFQILGELNKAPGQAAAGSVIAPRVYIPMKDLDATGLITFGSRAFYRTYFQLSAQADPGKIAAQIKPKLKPLRMNITTVAQQRRNFGNTLGNLYRFLNLVALIALLLGCIGVASSIHVYIKQKLESIAVLRCLGAKIRQTFLIYLIQAFVLGFIGSVAGILLGIAVQTVLPAVLKDFLPVQIDFEISTLAIFEGLLIGSLMTILFSLLPLLSIRKVTPLLALRASFDSEKRQPDPLRLLIFFLIVLVVFAFSIFQSREWVTGVIFAAGLFLAFAILTGIGKLLMISAKKFFPTSWTYIWRQSLANLYRPNNQTLVLILSLGLGTFLIGTLFITQTTLLRQISLTDQDQQPNLVLFDIQPDQTEAVKSLMRDYDLPVYQHVPIVTMRLQKINGRRVEDIRDDTTSSAPSWALMREYRVTYRDSLINTEEISDGEWIARGSDTAAVIPISLEKDIAADLGVTIGDSIVMDVQGVPMSTRVSSLRDVNWQRVQPNFFIVFPSGVLEEAPQFYVLVTRAPSPEISAKVQQSVVRQFPNVSAIDLALVLRTVESILDKISFVIRFMAVFSILTGLIVLIASISTTRFQRLQESVLLRTLGAKRQQISQILALEYLYLGAFSAISGLVLSLISSWALAKFVFNTPLAIPFLPLVVTIIAVIFLTIFLGLLNSRSVVNRPPLEVLRAEV